MGRKRIGTYYGSGGTLLYCTLLKHAFGEPVSNCIEYIPPDTAADDMEAIWG